MGLYFCTECDRLFGGLDAFDKHVNGDGCIAPEAAGLIEVPCDPPYWLAKEIETKGRTVPRAKFILSGYKPNLNIPLRGTERLSKALYS